MTVECNTMSRGGQTRPYRPFQVHVAASPVPPQQTTATLRAGFREWPVENPGRRTNSLLMANSITQSLHRNCQLADLDLIHAVGAPWGRQRCRDAAMHRCPTLRAAFHIIMAGASQARLGIWSSISPPPEIIKAASLSVALRTASRLQVIIP